MIFPLLEQGCQVHFLKQVKIVIAGNSIRSQANIYSLMHQRLDGSNAIGELEVTARIVGNAHLAFP